MSQSKGGGDGESKSRMKTGGERVGEREEGGAGEKGRSFSCNTGI